MRILFLTCILGVYSVLFLVVTGKQATPPVRTRDHRIFLLGAVLQVLFLGVLYYFVALGLEKLIVALAH